MRFQPWREVQGRMGQSSDAVDMAAAGPRRGGRRSTLVLVLLICATLGGIGVALFQTISAERNARDRVERTSEVLLLLRSALRAGTDAETGQRGFLLTGDRTYLQPYQDGATRWLPILDQLRAAIETDGVDGQRALVARLEGVARAKLDELELTVELAEEGRGAEAIDLVRAGSGQELMAEIRALTDRLEEEETALLRAALDRTRRVEGRTVPILVLLTFGVVALAAAGLLSERRSVRAEALARNAHEIEAARERSDLLARELNHRVKNLFAVIVSIVGLSGRGQTDVPEVVRTIRSRILALSRAHAVSAGQLGDEAVPLGEVVAPVLAPYGAADGTGQISLDGDPVELPAASVTPLGMIVHELATNAAKYGALSAEGGRVDVTWAVSGADPVPDVSLTWVERGGPRTGDAHPSGFGTVMMDQAVGQLGGRIEREWSPDGLRATLLFPLSRTR